MMVPKHKNKIFHVILAFRTMRTMKTKEKSENDPLMSKFGVGHISGTGNSKIEGGIQIILYTTTTSNRKDEQMA